MEEDFFNKDSFLETSTYDKYLKEFILRYKSYENIGYIYIRVSTKEQVQNSPYSQLKDILEYALENGIYVSRENIFIDGGISGRHADNRIEFQQMIEKALTRSNKCDFVLIHKYDRFARNKEESVIYKAKLKRAGIKLIAVKELLPEDKKLALILENQLETNSELYSINLSDEVCKGLRVLADEGKHVNRPPYGYKKVFKEVIKIKNKDKIIKEMVIYEQEANIVKLIFEWFVNGMTVYKIAQKLNEMGVKTHDGRSWYDNRVRYVLQNKTYIGLTHWTEKGKDTIVRQGSFPAIIDTDTWNKVQELLKLNENENKKMRTEVKNDHWLRGKIRCSDCNNTLVICGTSWQCGGYTHGECRISHSITIEKMENIFLELIKNLTRDKIININISKIKIQNNDEVAIIEDKLKDLKTQKSRIMTAYETQLYTLEEFKERKLKIEYEEELLSKKLNELKNKEDFKDLQNEVYKNCESMVEVLLDENIPNLDKRIMIDKVIDKIIFDKKNKTFEVYYKT